MCHPVNKAKELHPLLETVAAVVVGPGLGRQWWGESLWDAVLECRTAPGRRCGCPELFSQKAHSASELDYHTAPREKLGDYFKTDSADIQRDRFPAVKSLQTRFGGIAVLKGAGALIADGIQPIAVCAMGNPGMASGGMGDVTERCFGWFNRQGCAYPEAARLGVLPPRCRDRAAQEGGERGLLALDVVKKLRGVVNGI